MLFRLTSGVLRGTGSCSGLEFDGRCLLLVQRVVNIIESRVIKASSIVRISLVEVAISESEVAFVTERGIVVSSVNLHSTVDVYRLEDYPTYQTLQLPFHCNQKDCGCAPLVCSSYIDVLLL